MGWSVERMGRERRRDPYLCKALGLPGIPGRATVSEQGKHLPLASALAQVPGAGSP